MVIALSRSDKHVPLTLLKGISNMRPVRSSNTGRASVMRALL